ncbi:calcium-binding protein [Ancylothrix sp. C2]|uniref:calcium-binding protein n=1 Tax=Ancylothrix sp. D3o TaxID=2953691 RepID=UPI0021BBA031|nr:calcium-binding protein [Ancylothrix sp. D3o]MCT7949535.1 calcium-binding protein [Ancylothrix sp. D3o]
MPTAVFPEYVGDEELLEGFYEGVIDLPDSVFESGTTVGSPNGGSGNNSGTDQADSLRGNTGSDTLLGLAGNDTIEGVGGPDWLYGNGDDDSILGGQDSDTILGGRGNDLLFGNEGSDYLNGNRESDTLFGGAGDDSIYGGQDNDSLLGEAGNDTMLGNLGADTLTGGDGADQFVIAKATGGTSLSNADVITDYRPGQDLILLGDNLTVQDLRLSAGTGEQQGNLVIQLQETNDYLLILQGIAGNNLGGGNFSPAVF